MRRLGVTGEPLTVPWQGDCSVCRSLAADPQPGLMTWAQAVGSHFVREHDVELVQTPIPEPEVPAEIARKPAPARVKIYIDRRDWWVGYYRGDSHHYVCPLPCVVIRWARS